MATLEVSDSYTLFVSMWIKQIYCVTKLCLFAADTNRYTFNKLLLNYRTVFVYNSALNTNRLNENIKIKAFLKEDKILFHISGCSIYIVLVNAISESFNRY